MALGDLRSALGGLENLCSSDYSPLCLVNRNLGFLLLVHQSSHYICTRELSSPQGDSRNGRARCGGAGQGGKILEMRSREELILATNHSQSFKKPSGTF